VCVCSVRYPAWDAHTPSVACPDLQNFSTLSHKRYDFRVGQGVGVGMGEVIEHKLRVLIFLQLLYETYLIPRRCEFINVYRPSFEVHIFLVRY